MSKTGNKGLPCTGLPSDFDGKEYVKAQIEIISFEFKDVLTTSGDDPWINDPYSLDIKG